MKADIKKTVILINLIAREPNLPHFFVLKCVGEYERFLSSALTEYLYLKKEAGSHHHCNSFHLAVNKCIGSK